MINLDTLSATFFFRRKIVASGTQDFLEAMIVRMYIQNVFVLELSE